MKYVRLKEILRESKIVSDSPNPDKRITVKLNTGGVEKRVLKEEAEGATKYFIRHKGQFIYGKQNLFKGAFGIVPDELDGFESTSDIPSFDVDDSCYADWIVRYLQCNKLYKKLEGLAKGSSSKRIHPEQLYNIEIPLPNKDVQKTKLNDIKNVEVIVKESLLNINSQEKYITLLRQSILQQAIEGKLCEQNPDDEPANIFFKKIQEEKEKLISERKIKKHKESNPINEVEKPFELPRGWVWCRLEDIIFQLPQNGYSPNRVDYITNTKVLTLTATTRGILDINQYKYVDDNISKASHLWVKQGDILIQRSNSIDYVGIACLCEVDLQGYIYPDLMMKLQCLPSINLKFILLCLRSPYIRNYFRNKASGTSNSMKKITQGIVANTVIPLPPFAEQQRIVEKTERLMALCDKLEQEVKKVKSYSSQLMEAVLQEAFGSEKRSIQGTIIEYVSKPQLQQKQMQFTAAARGNVKESTWNNLVARALEIVCEDN
ncbi:Restriction endonuclease S subunit [Anaerocolumna jejuensis DSM 15929]|uniref:Restriction endonuclease S subunit n=1 Tax=Anaerocolumna jejuensis DSM 15929 TaxID=1121322 RepID=A0A1M6MBR1_9FIRM|nr:restriction endonuclease subunit S [Anaerocolumna jejuensis]SHJ80855.1 Restriction endonuclease S subunit [Anaerocolumna jejuensis DSM 15929]